MAISNKIPLILMFPVAAVAIYFIGNDVADVPSRMVESSRDWILVFLGVYVVNYAIAWFLKNSWPGSMARMLICGLFAYIAISELVDLLGGYWGHWGQLLGGEGRLNVNTVSAARFSTTAWTVNIVMMILCIAVGFESADDSKNESETP